MSNELYSELSVKLSKNIDIKTKKEEGIYFSSQNTIKQSIQIIQPFLTNCNRILEPSCGTCEFINSLDNIVTNANIDCIEYNKTIFNEVQSLQIKNATNFIHHDFLTLNTNTKYNLIIGNPPYFVIPKNNVEKKYHSYFSGRPNIFNIFIAKSLELLEKDGILCFVLPKPFLNCIYYDNMRSHIYNNYEIIAIEETNDAKFIDTAQETIIFVLRNSKPVNNDTFTIMKNGFTIFQDTSNITHIKELYNNSTTLDEMNFKVSVGTVVWNQKKTDLTDDSSKTTLIYSSNIEDGKIVEKTFKEPTKKQYITYDGNSDVCLVVNRGYGNGEYKFNYALVNQKKPYLLENHIICISPQIKMTKTKLLAQYKKIIQSFDNEKTEQFIKKYFSNNAINVTEMQHILPIY
jgi:adenine-specific DNA-methyltransferase